jgi:uncharacterized RDD family membrane protein YckC
MSEPSATRATGSATMPPRDERRVAAPLLRRMSAFMYEGVLLFGVLFALNLVYFGFTKQNLAGRSNSPMMVLSFLVLGAYFIHFWTRGGQTLALKTWHLRVTAQDGGPLSPKRALARYLAAWLWFMPPFALVKALALPPSFAWYFGLPLAWIVVYALSSYLHPRRQFWHDALCDTAVVFVPPAPQRVL